MIAPEGWPFVLIPMCLGIVCIVLGWEIPGWLLVGLGLFGLFFFRNPARTCEAPPNVACAPADGTVIAVDEAPPELTQRGLPRRVSIFMSVFNVHVNRAPLDGRLVEYHYNPGKKFSAFKEKASLENEQNLSVWDTPWGPIAFKQIAGLIARRIVFDHEPGDEVTRGERVGLIRYGSRVDVFFPESVEILVAPDDRVHAARTPIARYPLPEEG